MRSGDRMHVGEKVPASDTKTRTEPIFRRVLVAVEDPSQVKQVVELARGAGASEHGFGGFVGGVLGDEFAAEGFGEYRLFKGHRTREPRLKHQLEFAHTV